MEQKIDYSLKITIGEFDTPFRGPFDLVAELSCCLRDWGVKTSNYSITLEVVPHEES